jgi:hypothetical protein
MRIAGFRDAAAGAFRAAGVFGRDEADIGHQALGTTRGRSSRPSIRHHVARRLAQPLRLSRQSYRWRMSPLRCRQQHPRPCASRSSTRSRPSSSRRKPPSPYATFRKHRTFTKHLQTYAGAQPQTRVASRALGGRKLTAERHGDMHYHRCIASTIKSPLFSGLYVPRKEVEGVRFR